MALAGFIISILAFLFSLFIYFVHDKKIKDQTKRINDYQIQKIYNANIEDWTAKIEATVHRISNRNRKLLVYNKGNSIAKNVNIIFQNIVEFRVLSNPFPIDILPNNSIEINFQVAIVGPDKIELQFEWDDDFNEHNFDKQTLQIN